MKALSICFGLLFYSWFSICQFIQTSSIDELKSAYSGTIMWDEDNCILTFVSSGQINFPKRDHFKDIYWKVPSIVRKIIIGKEVTVVGHFHVSHTITIEGEDRKSSKVYGTPISGLLRLHNLDAGGGTVPYSAFFGSGDFEFHIRNLTSINPIGFHFTGKNGCIIHLDSVDAIDNRGGHHNHSDGISAANGSTVKNCFFSSGDDIIKVYNDIYVENTTIELIQNAVPIQFGWGNYGSGATGTFKNLKVYGNFGRRNTGNAVIDARKGYYDKNLIFDGLTIDAPNSYLFNFWNESANGKQGGGHANITAKNVNIKAMGFIKRSNMEADIEICEQHFDQNTNQTEFQCD
ncbi:hypothetical protein [Reichenbachiella ulvae]|uniref:Right handed beta helix region n=1 Tax=Reichenbachiella ulvae TaxID=2980104 RepID=A0ABT3CZY8_9BACT|nr:hypothetical protein [Reichenbachiella ulvae]MCV9389261.1 hypothetical protein [Reichenbachiella ulvae]